MANITINPSNSYAIWALYSIHNFKLLFKFLFDRKTIFFLVLLKKFAWKTLNLFLENVTQDKSIYGKTKNKNCN